MTKLQKLAEIKTLQGYKVFLEELKTRIRTSQLKAAVKVNEELIKLYWDLGREIAEKQESSRWGSSIIEKLAKDLQEAFPGIDGFSRTNIFRMRAFYLAYQKVPQPVAQINEKIPQPVGQLELPVFRIPWGHNALILERVKSFEERLWYAQQTIQNGWSRSSLEDWIKADLFKRQGKAITNFKDQLSLPQSRLAEETLKDPYNFDFLRLSDGYREKELEQGLIEHIQKFLIELGQGFAFLGRQYPLTVDGDVHYIDLLFYHVKLHCYVVVELKASSFDPRDAGQMNFYLSAVDAMLKSQEDQPSIGLLLCKDKKGLKVEYALQDIGKPIGIASYETQILDKLPKAFKGSLPTVQEIEAELEFTAKENGWFYRI